MADSDDSTFHTSTVEANRARQQGLGVGQRELEAQADPTPAEGVEEHVGSKGAESGTQTPPIDGLEQGATVTSPEGDDSPGTDVSGAGFRGAPD